MLMGPELAAPCARTIADAVPGSQVVFHFQHRATVELLVHLGQLAGHHHAQRRSPDRGQVGESFEDAVGSFIKDERGGRFAGSGGLRGGLGQVFEAGAAGTGFFRQKTEEVELRGGQARGDEAADRGVGTGNGVDCDLGRDGGLDEPSAGVADAGHAGV